MDVPDLLKCLHHFATIDGFVGFGFPFKVLLNFLEHGSHVFDGILWQK
jgi:hypothetical protein